MVSEIPFELSLRRFRSAGSVIQIGRKCFGFQDYLTVTARRHAWRFDINDFVWCISSVAEFRATAQRIVTETIQEWRNQDISCIFFSEFFSPTQFGVRNAQGITQLVLRHWCHK